MVGPLAEAPGSLLKIEGTSSSRSSDLSLPIYIDSSTLALWRSCHRKYFWQVLNSLYPTARSIDLIAGGAFAAGMEAARRLVFTRASNHRPTHDDLLFVAYKAFSREWGDFLPQEDSPKSFENTFQALAEYLRIYPPETDVAQPLRRPDGSPTVEFTFAIPIEEGPKHPETGDHFLFVGRFDLLGAYNDLPCILDEKTTTSIGFAWDSQWDLRGQFMGYLWACQQLGYPVNTAVIRGIGILKREYKFATSIKQYPQHLIDRWYRLLLKDLNAIVHSYRYTTNHVIAVTSEEDLEEAFPYNFSDACTAYRGCAFTTLCSAQNAENFFSNYIRHRWNPLAKQPLSEKEEPK